MEKDQIIYRTRTAFGQSGDIGFYAIAAVVNEMAAQGISAFRMSVKLLLPFYAQKSHMYEMKKRITGICREQGIILDELQAETQAGVSQYMAVVTGAGIAAQEQKGEREPIRAGQEIVLAKWIGMEGTLRIVQEREAELKQRFAPVFLNRVDSFRDEIFAGKECGVARASGVSHIYQVGEGGIFAALWRLAKDAELGLEADLKKLSIRQETIEVCEYFRLNPYQLASAGSMLMITGRGEELADALLQEEIEASVIGSFKDNNDKIIRNGGERRYIDRPAPDELNQIFMKEKDNERH